MTIKSFKDFLNDLEDADEISNGIDYFIIEISHDNISEEMFINEGRWTQSGKKNWMYRIDAENPALNQQRHVHIAQSKHLNAKNQQVAWNQDGSKHDKKTFNKNIAKLNVVQSIAKETLNLGSSIKLEEAAIAPNLLVQINEALDGDAPCLPKLFRAV